jgi:CheY-like chemotaxis protein
MMTVPLGTSFTLLVVEDNVDLLDFLQMSLPKLGPFTVTCAADGIIGLEQAFALNPDCMVIDVKMPGLDGYQLVRALRGDQATADIPLIILTAMAQEQDQFIGLASGADIYLTKPVVLPVLVAAIHQALHLSMDERTARFTQLAHQDEPGQ